jgi:hypothetical protein
LNDNLNATAEHSKDTEGNFWALNLVLAACHAVTGTIADAMAWVIIPNSGAVGDIACLCAFARK